MQSKKHSSARIFVLDSDLAHAEAVSQVLRARAKVEIYASWGVLEVDQEEDIVLLNCDTVSPLEQAALLEGFPRLREKRRILTYSSNFRREGFVHLFGDLGVSNFLARNEVVDAEELFVTTHKILTGEIFVVDIYFSWGARALTLSLHRTTDKDAVVEQVNQFADEVGTQPRLRDMLATVTDELISNALYDAPVDAQGQFRFAHYSRTIGVELEAREATTVTLCCDGRRLGISVADPFGSLPPQKVSDYLVKCFQRGESQIDRKEGGAGLGLYYAFESLSHLIVNIRPGVSTEVVGLLDIRGTYRDFASRGKSLNIFVAE